MLLTKGYEVNVLIEEKISNKLILKNRIRKIGLWRVLGQVLFMLFVLPILKRKEKAKKELLFSKYDLSSDGYIKKAVRVHSVNSDESRKELTKQNPGLVVVSGTRIISQKTLNCIDVPILNIHAGITPYYRGVHGGYWALRNKDFGNCGVTLHLVDKGIDTGSVIAQQVIQVQTDDNFTTYPIIQLKTGLDLLEENLDAIISNNFELGSSPDKGSLYYHPSIFDYLGARFFRGVR